MSKQTKADQHAAWEADCEDWQDRKDAMNAAAKNPERSTDPPNWYFACGCVEHGRGGKTICERHAKWFAEAAGASVPQEAAATAEWLREQWRLEMYPFTDHDTFEAFFADLAASGWDEVRRELAALTAVVARLTGETSSATQGEQQDDTSRCAICAWPLAETIEQGCVRGSCSQRPLPRTLYRPDRAALEYDGRLDMSRFTNGHLAAAPSSPAREP